MGGQRDRLGRPGRSTVHIADPVIGSPFSARQRQLALVAVAATLIAYAMITAFGNIALPRIDSFVPTVMAISFVADLVIAILLYAQFSATNSRAMLVLASGYLFSSLIVIPYTLAFPGAFAPTGLLGAGPQSAPYFVVSGRLGVSLTFLAYACLVARTPRKDTPWLAKPAWTIWAVAIVIGVVGALTGVGIAADDLLPSLVTNVGISPWGHACMGLATLLCAPTLLLLLRHGRSFHDLWIMVAVCGLIIDGAALALFPTARFTLGFYGVLVAWLAVSKIVLVALLWETMTLHARLQISYRELRRERANRFTSAEAVVASIAHEIRQPLTNINLLAFAGQGLLDRAPPDVGGVKKNLEEIEEDAFRVNEVFDAFLGLFRGGKQQWQAADVNAVTLEAIESLRRELDEHQVTVKTHLTPEPVLVRSHAGQLREVILNLLQNAMEAMAPTPSGPRMIIITTARLADGAVSISVQDTGPGIEPKTLPSIFDTFVTTKAKGTGLGLAICKLIVEQHGGELRATSDENGGARFEITLPDGNYDKVAQSDGLQVIR